jgi:fructosamine-3-kinase
VSGQGGAGDAPLVAAIGQAIGAATGLTFAARTLRSLGGGCIHRALALSDGARRYFAKCNDAAAAAMFEAEADGLRALAACGAIRVPRVVASGVAAGQSFLVLEYLDLDGSGDGRALGRALAQMHRCRGPRFGWPRDNYIGATEQRNAPAGDWAAFYAARRLVPQLEWARARGCGRRLYDEGMELAQQAGAFFTGYSPQPSLLHGDLWGGNADYLADGTPVIFDPAVYWGDREADLAMTELFGGFGAGFMSAYREAWPVDSGYGVRRTLYNLYHVLNHYKLFGGAYATQAESMVKRLLAEVLA